MKIQGKLVRAKKAEQICYEISDRLEISIEKIAEYLGPQTILVEQKFLVNEDDVKDENEKIKEILFKNKIVYYLNFDLNTRTLLLNARTFNTIFTAWNNTILIDITGFRLFVPAKTEKDIVNKLSRALKYGFML